MTICWHCKSEHDRAHHDRVVYNRTALYGPWYGWRMAGRVLVSPEGDRIAPERLRGLLWSERLRIRKSGQQDGVAAVSTLPARERFAGSA